MIDAGSRTQRLKYDINFAVDVDTLLMHTDISQPTKQTPPGA
jgi:hypothetical protein